MKWISKLLGRPGTKSAAPASAPIAQKAEPAEDVERLRAALASAVDSGERMPLADRLGRALAVQGQAPRDEDPPEVWVAAVCHAPDKALGLEWSANLSGDTCLGEVASQARNAEVRYAAAQRIAATVVLDQVAHASRGKDKRVYRHCSDLVRQRRQAAASASRAQDIADELRGLLASSEPLPLSHLIELNKELGDLEESGEQGMACQALMAQALDRVREEGEARRDMQTNLDAAAALASECASAAWPWTEQLDNWRGRVDAMRQARAGSPAWLSGQAGARRLDASLHGIEARLAGLATDTARFLACEQFIDNLETDQAPDAETAAAWASLPKPDHAAARQALDARWQALAGSMPPAAENKAEPVPPPPLPRIDHAAVRRQLDTLEQAIAAGHLGDADAAAKQIKDALAGNGLHGALESRLHRAQAQLEQLRGWARWGTGQAREQLIAAAEALLEGEHDVDALAVTIPALREEWKRLNAHGAASKAQWEGFDTALEKAYAPVAARRAEDEARQAAARAAKGALCDAWEAEVAGIVWEYADFKVIEARRGALLKQWQAMSQAGFRDERVLRKRFDTLIARIDRRLDTARAAECERREQLIAAAEAVRDQPDLGQAMTEAKALQGRWNQQAVAVRLRRSDEQKLWQRFRAACNAVFERRDALRTEQAAQRQEQVQSRQRLLDAFAAALAGTDAHAIKRALEQFRADWNATRPAGREGGDSLETRARDLQAQALQRLDALRQEKHRARFDLLAQRAALAERVEAAALAAGPLESVLAEAQQAWETLPPLPGKSEAQLARRLAAAASVTQAALDAGREARASVLLDLEIDLDLPSPESCAEDRRQRQLARLQNRFGAAAPQSSEPEELLVRWYATAALPDAALDRRLAAVVSHLAAQAGPRSKPSA